MLVRTQSSLKQLMHPLGLAHRNGHPQLRTGESEAQAAGSSLELRDFFNSELVPDGRLALSFIDISLQPRRYPRKILSGLNGAVHCGSVLGIIGASGSGKCEISYSGFRDIPRSIKLIHISNLC
jgi:ABC-type transport system involved in Fe-S cluster assembly fused permease/ATPase subunit